MAHGGGPIETRNGAPNHVIAAGHDDHMSVGNKLCRNSPDVQIQYVHAEYQPAF